MSTRFLGALCACLLGLSLAAGPAAAADPQKKPTDFRDLKWGAAPAALPGLTAVDRDGDIVHYARPGEKKDVGGVTLGHVTYSFYKDKFYHAEIDYEGKEAAAAMQRSLEAKYGPPDATREKTDPAGKPYVVSTWDWPGFAFIGNRHDKDGRHGRVFYFYAPLTDASAKAQGLAPAPAAAKQAAGGPTYRVKRGDSLERIAKTRGTTEEALIAANPGLSDKTLKAGATINLPAGTPPAPPAAAADEASEERPKKAPEKAPSAASGKFIRYTIKDGDILSKVASSHGVRTKDILEANPGIHPENLKLGTEIKIPAKAEGK